jgi:hypothetical protein
VAGEYPRGYKSRLKVTSKHQIMVVGVIWLKNLCDAHWEK